MIYLNIFDSKHAEILVTCKKNLNLLDIFSVNCKKVKFTISERVGKSTSCQTFSFFFQKLQVFLFPLEVNIIIIWPVHKRYSTFFLRCFQTLKIIK